MGYALLQWLISASALLMTAYLVRGFEVKSFFAAAVAAIVIGFANVVVWPVFMFLTLPINILTFGLFTLVVNGAVLRLVAALLPGFAISGWISAIFGALILSFITSALRFIAFY
jgi:putative membrane protein